MFQLNQIWTWNFLLKVFSIAVILKYGRHWKWNDRYSSVSNTITQSFTFITLIVSKNTSNTNTHTPYTHTHTSKNRCMHRTSSVTHSRWGAKLKWTKPACAKPTMWLKRWKPYMLPTHQASDWWRWQTTLMVIVMKQMMREIVMVATIHTCSSRIRGSGASWYIHISDRGWCACGCSGRHRSDTNEVKLPRVTLFISLFPCSLLDRYLSYWVKDLLC